MLSYTSPSINLDLSIIHQSIILFLSAMLSYTYLHHSLDLAIMPTHLSVIQSILISPPCSYTPLSITLTHLSSHSIHLDLSINSDITPHQHHILISPASSHILHSRSLHHALITTLISPPCCPIYLPSFSITLSLSLDHALIHLASFYFHHTHQHTHPQVFVNDYTPFQFLWWWWQRIKWVPLFNIMIINL